MHIALSGSVLANASIPVVDLTNFTLDSCLLEGKGDEFRPHRTNVLTVQTPLLFINVDDWSAFVLDGMGEIVSICALQTAIQITYRVRVLEPCLPPPERIYVSILYRGISVFSSPVEICQNIFKNRGRLAFRAKFPDITILNNSYYLMDVFPDGSVIALHDKKHNNARIYEVLGNESGCQEITYRLSSIVSAGGYRRGRLTSTGSVVFSNHNQLEEVLFDGVIVRVFPFVYAYSFDICEAADCIAVSFSDSTDIVIAKFSTGEMISTIPHRRYSATVSLSPCGHWFCTSNYDNNGIHIYSVQTGELIKHMHFKDAIYVYQFASDQTILMYNYNTSMRSIVNISTGKECNFLPDVNCESHKLPFIRGACSYVVVDGILCAYE